MKVNSLTLSILLLPLLLSLTSCEGSKGSDGDCDEQMLDFFHMEPSDGIDIGCEMHLVKRVMEDALTGKTVHYYVGNHCLDMLVTPFDCDMEEASAHWFAGEQISEEIIGVQL